MNSVLREMKGTNVQEREREINGEGKGTDRRRMRDETG